MLQHLWLQKQAMLQKDRSSQASASPLSHHQTCTGKATPHHTGEPGSALEKPVLPQSQLLQKHQKYFLP